MKKALRHFRPQGFDMGEIRLFLFAGRCHVDGLAEYSFGSFADRFFDGGMRADKGSDLMKGDRKSVV